MKTWARLKKNPELFNQYFVKEYVIAAAREFFQKRDYHELESPVLSGALPQERYLDVLETDIELKGGKAHKAYLIPSTETFNKKILAAGLGEHFVITKVFRGLEDIGPNHSPEFTMLEWYHLDADYFDLMDDTQELVRFMKKYQDEKFGMKHNLKITYQGQEIDLDGEWYRFSVPELLEKHAGIKLASITQHKDFLKVAKAKGFNVDEGDDWQTIYEYIFANAIEPELPADKPIFVYDFPRILCPLTKVNKKNPLVSEKVELYIAGKEIANGYTELTDWEEQERRFVEEREARAKMGRKPIKMDLDFLDAIKSGLPPVAGIGMGLDRLAMIFADVKNISDINYFPATELFDD